MLTNQQDRLNYFVDKSQKLFDSKLADFVKSITNKAKMAGSLKEAVKRAESTTSQGENSKKKSWRINDMHLVALKK